MMSLIGISTVSLFGFRPETLWISNGTVTISRSIWRKSGGGEHSWPTCILWTEAFSVDHHPTPYPNPMPYAATVTTVMLVAM